MNHAQAEQVLISTASPEYANYVEFLRSRRAELLNELAVIADPTRMYRLQGAIMEVDALIVARESAIERLRNRR